VTLPVSPIQCLLKVLMCTITSVQISTRTGQTLADLMSKVNWHAFIRTVNGIK